MQFVKPDRRQLEDSFNGPVLIPVWHRTMWFHDRYSEEERPSYKKRSAEHHK